MKSIFYSDIKVENIIIEGEIIEKSELKIDLVF